MRRVPSHPSPTNTPHSLRFFNTKTTTIRCKKAEEERDAIAAKLAGAKKELEALMTKTALISRLLSETSGLLLLLPKRLNSLRLVKSLSHTTLSQSSASLDRTNSRPLRTSFRTLRTSLISLSGLDQELMTPLLSS